MDKPPLQVWLHTTNNCNLSCQYCYIRKTSQSLDSETGLYAIEKIFELALKHNYNHVHIKYGGGEPTLNLDLVEELHIYASTLAESTRLRLSGLLLTNGVRITSRTAQLICALGLQVSVSLDSLDSSHDVQRPFVSGMGSLSSVKRGVEELQAQNLTPHINIVVTGQNVGSLPSLMEWIVHKDLPFQINFYRQNLYSQTFEELQYEEGTLIQGLLDTLSVLETNPPSRSILDSIVDKAKLSYEHQHTCSVGKDYLVIDHNGKVSKCHSDIEKSISSIFNDDPLHDVRIDSIGIQNLHVNEKDGCRDCEWKNYCTGGCPLVTYRATGRYDVKSPNCNIYKAILPEVLRIEELRISKLDCASMPPNKA